MGQGRKRTGAVSVLFTARTWLGRHSQQDGMWSKGEGKYQCTNINSKFTQGHRKWLDNAEKLSDLMMFFTTRTRPLSAQP